MPKISEQIATSGGSYLNRTQRLREQDYIRQQEEQQNQDKEDAVNKLSQANNIDEYQQIYEGLPENQKSLVASPEQVKANQEQQRKNNISSINEQIGQAETTRTQYENQKSNSTNQEQEREADAEIQKYSELLRGLTQGKAKLESGQNIDIGNIEDYAQTLGQYAYERRTSKFANFDAVAKAQEALNNAPQLSDFTGTLTESNVKMGGESVVGTKFFIGGKQVLGGQFQSKYDIYSNANQPSLIVAKGSDITSLSPKIEVAKTPQYNITPTTDQRFIGQSTNSSQFADEGAVQNNFMGRLLKVIGIPINSLGIVGDLIGSIIPDTSLSGSRSLAPTTLSADYIKSKRLEIQQASFAQGLPFGLGNFISKPTTNAQTLSFALRRQLAKGTEQAKVLQNQRLGQISEIQIAQLELENINKNVGDLNNVITQNPKGITPQVASTIQSQYNQDITSRQAILDSLSSKGITTKVTTTPEGQQQIQFNSQALNTDLASSAVKELKGQTPFQQKVAVSDAIFQEVAEGVIVSLPIGLSGVIPETISKIPLATKAIVNFPNTVKAIVYGASILGLGANIGVASLTGYNTAKEFKSQGLSAGLGYTLGSGLILGKSSGLLIGATIGNRVYTQNILEKAQQATTKTTEGTFESEGKKYNLPEESKTGEAYTNEKGQIVQKTKQFGRSETRISTTEGDNPDADIIIKQQQKIYEQSIDNKYGGQGRSIAEITQGDNSIYPKGTKIESRFFLIKNPTDETQTGVVSLTKAKGGVNLDLFRTNVDVTNELLKDQPDSTKAFFIELTRSNEKLGNTIFLKGADINDLTSSDDVFQINTADIKDLLESNRLFNKLSEDKLFSFSGTNQLGFKSIKGDYASIYSNINGFQNEGIVVPEIPENAKNIQEFVTAGGSKSARIQSIKEFYNAYGFNLGETISKTDISQTSATGNILGMLGNKRGQLNVVLAESELSVPETTLLNPSSINNFQIPDLTRLNDISSLQLPSVIKNLNPIISSQINLKTLIGESAFLINTPKQSFSTKQVRLQSNIQNLMQFNILNTEQKQIPIQKNFSTQFQQQTPQLITSPELSPELTLPPFSNFSFPKNPPATPKLLNLGLDFDFNQKQNKKKSNKNNLKRLLGYSPDFTSIALGLPVKNVRQKDLSKLVRQTQTGLEIRQVINVIPNLKRIMKVGRIKKIRGIKY